MDKYIKLDDAIATLHKYFPVSFDRQDAEDDLKAIPAADGEEVKHATWECTDESDNVWECSGKDGCGEQYMFIVGTPEDNKFKWCPNCGAKMDVKGEK